MAVETRARRRQNSSPISTPGEEKKDGVEVVTPFIEHLSIKTLRRVLKYSFRSMAILGVLLFSSIVWYSSFVLAKFAWNSYHGLPFSFGVLEAYLLLEASFQVLMGLRYKVFKSLDASHLPRVQKSDFEDLLEEFSAIPDAGAWIQGWFFQAPLSDITVEDFREWTAAQFFNSTPGNLSRHEFDMMNRLVQAISDKLPHPLQKRAAGIDPTRKILLTLDPLHIYHRPLALYVGIWLIDAVCRVLLKAFGFHRADDKHLPYYIREGPSTEPAIVFFHGLGIGLTTYVLFAAALAFKYRDRNILLFEMPSITMKLDDNHVLPQDFSAHVADTLVSHGFTKNIVAGHSLGTACVAWMHRFHPHLIHSSLFIDPICFKLWHHHIAYNALYRKPRGFHEYFIHAVAMSEPGHALYLHRYFVWHQNAFLTKNLPENCIIFLSEKDNIVETKEVLEYLLQHPHPTRKIVLYKAFRHGQILASPEFTRVVSAFKELTL
ncbi:hypothetical protein HDV03_000545 [Kappamyces sp. JEL0829]|nr:hypothetical protein HDV03_000545 [Kappamyces sp. JEL0829]